MREKINFAVSFLAAVSLVGINAFAQTLSTSSQPSQGYGGQAAQAGVSGSATVSRSASAGTGVTQPGIIIRPFPPQPYPYPQDNDIVQFNNLTIKDISSPTPPAEIIAGYDYGIMPMMGGGSGVNMKNPDMQSRGTAVGSTTAKCFRYGDENAKAAAIPCPTPTAASASGTMQLQIQTNPASGNAAPSIVQMYPQPAAYRIEIDASTRLRLRDGSSATLADFAAGDHINTYGIYSSDGSIQALIVRDISKPAEKQFIQLNNVQVISIFSSSAATNMADIVVIQDRIYPCYGFGTEGKSARQILPCPMNSSKVGPNLTIPDSMRPIWNTARKYVVHVDAQTILMNRIKDHMNLSDIHAGDKLNIYGSTTNNKETIDADVVRDLTQPSVATNLSGTITQVNGDGSFVVQTDDGSTYTVQNSIQIGATVKLKGLLDELQKVISQVSELNVRNSQTPPPPTQCVPFDCAAPPDGCNYSGMTYDKNGCPISCGKLVCATPPPSGKVSISSINPDRGIVGSQIALKGSGFATNNVIHFGDYGVVPKIASSDGVTLTFAVPPALSPLCYFSTPACMVPSRITDPGAYSVWVSNDNGESNKVNFRVQYPNPDSNLQGGP